MSLPPVSYIPHWIWLFRGHCPSHPTMNKNKVVRRKSPRNSLFWTRNKADLNRAGKSSVSGYFQLLPLIHELSPVRHPQCSQVTVREKQPHYFLQGTGWCPQGTKNEKCTKKWTRGQYHLETVWVWRRKTMIMSFLFSNKNINQWYMKMSLKKSKRFMM